jgi:hypothetical protein
VQQRCEEHVALNHGSFVHQLPQFFNHPRKALLLLLETLLLGSSDDRTLQEAIAFVVANKSSRALAIPITREEVSADGSSRQVPLLDLSFVPDDWGERVTGQRTDPQQ